MTPSAPVGLVLPSREALRRNDPQLVTRFATDAEALGFGSVWAGDSLLARPLLDPFGVLGHVTALTSTITLGTAILLAPMRQPVLAAQALATLDLLSDGRLVVGLGQGFDLPETRREFAAAGADFDTRTRRLNHTIRLWRELWRDGSASIDQPYARLEDEACLPAPRQAGGPPIWLSGYGPASFDRVGRSADGWIPYPPSAALYRKGWDAVQAAAAGCGRDPAEITPAMMVTVSIGEPGPSIAELERYTETFYGYPLDLIGAVQACHAGSTDEIVGVLRRYWEAGARSFIVRVAAVDDPTPQLVTLADEILPEVARWSSPHSNPPTEPEPKESS